MKNIRKRKRKKNNKYIISIILHEILISINILKLFILSFLELYHHFIFFISLFTLFFFSFEGYSFIFLKMKKKF